MIVLGIYTDNLRHVIRVFRLEKMDANAVIEQPILVKIRKLWINIFNKTWQERKCFFFFSLSLFLWFQESCEERSITMHQRNQRNQVSWWERTQEHSDRNQEISQLICIQVKRDSSTSTAEDSPCFSSLILWLNWNRKKTWIISENFLNATESNVTERKRRLSNGS